VADGVGGGNLVVAGVKTVRGPQSHPVESHFMKAILERRAVVNGGIEEGFHGEFNNIHVDGEINGILVHIPPFADLLQSGGSLRSSDVSYNCPCPLAFDHLRLCGWMAQVAVAR
jgi:hypothetical protein